MQDSTRPLVFRCDATRETGLGHFARCRDLARLLKATEPELSIQFCGSLSSFAQAELLRLGYAYQKRELSEPVVSVDWLQEVDACIVDSYRLSPDEYRLLEQCSARVGIFDDFGGAQDAQVELVLNARVVADERFSYAARSVALGVQFLGPSLDLIEVRERRASAVLRSEVEAVTVCIGASDFYDAGSKVVDASLYAFPRAEIAWIGGRDAGPRVRGVPLTSAVAPLFQAADVVIAGGGRVKYEAGYCLVPVASVSQTVEQEEDTRELSAHGLCHDLGLASAASSHALRSVLAALNDREVREGFVRRQRAAFPADAPFELARLVRSALDLGRTG